MKNGLEIVGIDELKPLLDRKIDCLDPAFAPGTGTTVAFGLSSNPALQVLRRLWDLSLVGTELVEISPPSTG